MIEPNDTMKIAIGKKAILERTVYSYNALSVNCEHDWKVSAMHRTLTALQKSHLSTVDDLGLLFDLQALFW